jgi:succinylglutamate desuccinylase
MNDLIEVVEEQRDAALANFLQEKMQEIESCVLEHGHASDILSVKLANLLNIIQKLPDYVDEYATPQRPDAVK